MHKLYCISGLGADQRVFTYMDIADVEKVYIQWEKPLPDESLTAYCRRLLPQIDQTQPVWLLGVSFGGIVAQEIARLIPCEKLIILSSIKSRHEMGWQLRLAGSLGLHRIVPGFLLKLLNLLTASYYFGTRQKDDSRLLRQIIWDTDMRFAAWAVRQLFQWKGGYTFSIPLIHIHGTKDKIFPVKNISDYIPVSSGEHFMVVSRAEEVNTYIAHTLACLPSGWTGFSQAIRKQVAS